MKHSLHPHRGGEGLHLNILPVKAFLQELAPMDCQNTAAILISTHEIGKERLQGVPCHLVLRFADVTHTGADAFSRDIALQIKDFVENLREIHTLYVCCDAGESRSAAVAAVIARYLGMDEWAIWDNPRYHPNGLVYRLGCQAFGMRAGRLMLWYRMRRNAKALQKAIRNARRKR